MSIQHLYFHRPIGLLKLIALLACLSGSLSVFPVYARDISIAFIEDGKGGAGPRLSNLIVQELQPLLNTGDTLVPIFLGAEDVSPNVMDSLVWALANRQVDYVVATGFIGSQEIYKVTKFSKPTYLLRVLDPNLTGIKARDKVRNLRSYSTVNEIVGVFDRLNTLFKPKRVGILLSSSESGAQRSLDGPIAAAAKKAGISAQFLILDFGSDLALQLADLDAVVLPPISTSKLERGALLSILQRQKIPSFAVGGDSMVLSGALISDTLDEDERVLARRVALDLQLAITGEARTQGMRLLDPKKRTTINIDTARAIEVDFTFEEIITARVVQGNSSESVLGFLAALELATDRNLSLRGQFQQLRIDEESLEQARAKRGPQVSAQLSYTRRGEQLPENETFAAVGLSQTIYSSSVNAGVDVAKYGLTASQKMLAQKQIDTIQLTSGTYFQALQTQALFESKLRDLALNRENLLLAEQLNRSGSGSGAGIYRWQAVVAASESAVLNAYTNNTRAQSELAQRLNTRLQIPTQLADVYLDQPPFDVLHESIEPFLKSTGQAELLRQASAARALEQSPQIDSAEANVAANDILLSATKRSFYTPELSLSAEYGRFLDSSVTAAGFELDDSDDWEVSLKATLPLWDSGTRRSLVHQYGAQKTQAQTQLQSVQIALWANSNDAVNDLIANYRAISLSDQAETASLKSQQITQRAYKLGSASVTELLDTQNEYREAQDNANAARYQYLTALVNFQALMGDMFMLMPVAEQRQRLQSFKQNMLNQAKQ